MSRPFTAVEQKLIVDYIVEKDAMHRVKGDQLWKEMEEDKVTDRTWQSLKQHFRKTIQLQLHYPRYELDPAIVQRFRGTFSQVDLKAKKKKLEASSSEENGSVEHSEEASSSRDSDVVVSSNTVSPDDDEDAEYMVILE